MIFFISREQDIDNVILMQSMGNVSFNKLRKLTVRMCETVPTKSLDEKSVPKKSNKYGGKWFQTCSDIFCGKYISGSKKINPIWQEEIQGPKKSTQYGGKKKSTQHGGKKYRVQKNQANTAGRNTSLVCETWVPTKFSNLSNV